MQTFDVAIGVPTVERCSANSGGKGNKNDIEEMHFEQAGAPVVSGVWIVERLKNQSISSYLSSRLNRLLMRKVISSLNIELFHALLIYYDSRTLQYEWLVAAICRYPRRPRPGT